MMLAFRPYPGFDPCDGAEPHVALAMDNPIRRNPCARTVDPQLRPARPQLDRDWFARKGRA